MTGRCPEIAARPTWTSPLTMAPGPSIVKSSMIDVVTDDAPGQSMTWSPIAAPPPIDDAGGRRSHHDPSRARGETEAAGCTSVANRSAARPVAARISGSDCGSCGRCRSR